MATVKVRGEGDKPLQQGVGRKQCLSKRASPTGVHSGTQHDMSKASLHLVDMQD